MTNAGKNIPRRSFLAMAAVAGVLPAIKKSKRVPVGLELYSVRDQLKEDLPNTLRTVAKMGYAGVEFYAPYLEWTAADAKDVRRQLDELNLRCYSTHNGSAAFEAAKIDHAIELNRILGSRFIVMASAGKVEGLDGWKTVADKLNSAAEKMKPANLRAGFHNHRDEFVPLGGRRPMDVLAAGTDKKVVLQLDVGTCLEAGADPVAWINRNPGRIVSLHLKDWSPDAAKGYRVLFGEGAAPWKKIFAAAEKKGGVEYYLIEQEGSDLPPFETAERCLAAYRQMRAG